MNHNEELLRKIKGKVLFNEHMRNHTTFKIGGPADILMVPKDLADIKFCITYAKERRIPLYVIGNGSKLLVSDNGIRGIVIKIAKTLDCIEVSGERITAGAGCSISELIKIATQHYLSGIEFAAGIPGTLGGAIAMNAGTYLGSMSDIVSKVTVMDLLNGSLHILAKDDCSFGYRKSIFLENGLIILKAELNMKKGNQNEIKEKINRLHKKRKRTQPLEKHNAGSIFKNTANVSAGKLIDAAGLKGFRIGDAQISEKHANFIVNLEKARAWDVLELMKIIQKKVKSKYGTTLIPELKQIGDFIQSNSETSLP